MEKENRDFYEPSRVNTYDPEKLRKKSGSGWKKGLVIFLIIVVILLGAGIGCNMGTGRIIHLNIGSSAGDYSYDSDYIGILRIDGTISSDEDATDSYNQSWILARLNQMEKDDLNKGLILSINTPGGSVYATDEVYLKVKEYQEVTGRPVYTYMGSMAASGGYYISSASDKIYANRNCWTGSIGVTIGTIYDISGLLENLGVKTVTITSGKNKAMGSSVEPLTKEQKEIYQSLVDEAYDQFVEIVAEGRNMKLSKVKKLADGRVYTAKQAKANGLIDEIGTLDDVIADMEDTYQLRECDTQIMSYTPKTSVLSLLTGLVESKSAESEYDQILELMEENNAFTVTYMSQVRK